MAPLLPCSACVRYDHGACQKEGPCRGPAANTLPLSLSLLSLPQMCNIPGLSTQLDLLLTLRELPISMSDLQPVSPARRRPAEAT